MRIRCATLGLHREAHAAIADGHTKDDIHVGIFPIRRGEIFHLQTRVPKPPYSVHKHILMISTVIMT